MILPLFLGQFYIFNLERGFRLSEGEEFLNFVFDCKQAIPHVSLYLKIGARQLGSVAEIAPKSAAVTSEQKPYSVWFKCRRKAIWCERSLSPKEFNLKRESLWSRGLLRAAYRSTLVELSKTKFLKYSLAGIKLSLIRLVIILSV